MNIDHVKTTLRRIAKMRGRDFDITIGTGKYDKCIKMADYIASATRKVKSKKLINYQYYNKIRTPLPKLYIQKAFR